MHIIFIGTHEQVLCCEKYATNFAFGPMHKQTIHPGKHVGGTKGSKKGKDNAFAIVVYYDVFPKIRAKTLGFVDSSEAYTNKVVSGFDWLVRGDEHWIDEDCVLMKIRGKSCEKIEHIIEKMKSDLKIAEDELAEKKEKELHGMIPLPEAVKSEEDVEEMEE